MMRFSSSSPDYLDNGGMEFGESDFDTLGFDDDIIGDSDSIFNRQAGTITEAMHSESSKFGLATVGNEDFANILGSSDDPSSESDSQVVVANPPIAVDTRNANSPNDGAVALRPTSIADLINHTLSTSRQQRFAKDEFAGLLRYMTRELPNCDFQSGSKRFTSPIVHAWRLRETEEVIFPTGLEWLKDHNKVINENNLKQFFHANLKDFITQLEKLSPAQKKSADSSSSPGVSNTLNSHSNPAYQHALLTTAVNGLEPRTPSIGDAIKSMIDKLLSSHNKNQNLAETMSNVRKELVKSLPEITPERLALHAQLLEEFQATMDGAFNLMTKEIMFSPESVRLGVPLQSTEYRSRSQKIMSIESLLQKALSNVDRMNTIFLSVTAEASLQVMVQTFRSLLFEVRKYIDKYDIPSVDSQMSLTSSLNNLLRKTYPSVLEAFRQPFSDSDKEIYAVLTSSDQHSKNDILVSAVMTFESVNEELFPRMAVACKLVVERPSENGTVLYERLDKNWFPDPKYTLQDKSLLMKISGLVPLLEEIQSHLNRKSESRSHTDATDVVESSSSTLQMVTSKESEKTKGFIRRFFYVKDLWSLLETDEKSLGRLGSLRPLSGSILDLLDPRYIHRFFRFGLYLANLQGKQRSAKSVMSDINSLALILRILSLQLPNHDRVRRAELCLTKIRSIVGDLLAQSTKPSQISLINNGSFMVLGERIVYKAWLESFLCSRIDKVTKENPTEFAMRTYLNAFTAYLEEVVPGVRRQVYLATKTSIRVTNGSAGQLNSLGLPPTEEEGAGHLHLASNEVIGDSTEFVIYFPRNQAEKSTNKYDTLPIKSPLFIRLLRIYIVHVRSHFLSKTGSDSGKPSSTGALLVDYNGKPAKPSHITNCVPISQSSKRY